MDKDTNARLQAAAPKMLDTFIRIARGACLQQINGDKCVCYSCMAKEIVAEVIDK